MRNGFPRRPAASVRGACPTRLRGAQGAPWRRMFSCASAQLAARGVAPLTLRPAAGYHDRMRRAAIRLSYSQILRLRRCPWAWHARHVRGLVPLRRKRPPPVWGDAYHAAAAAVWRSRAFLERSGIWLDPAYPVEDGRLDALARLRELDVPGLDNEVLAAEVAQAAVEVCKFVGPEWRVLWLDGEPVVERRLMTQIGEVLLPECCGDTYCMCGTCEARPVELVTVLDLALVRKDGRVRVVDHKTTTSWPEQVGDVLRADEDLDLDLRDDLQIRLYVLALHNAMLDAALKAGAYPLKTVTYHVPLMNGALLDVSVEDLDVQIEGYHLVRRATVGHEPPRTRNGHGPLSRAAEHEATVEQWMTALRRHHLRPEDYEQQIAQARLRRWQAWAPSEFTPQSLELARREALQAAEEIARLESSDNVPRFRKPGRWMQFRPGHGSGAQPKTSAEVFHWDSCAACDWRELCVAEGQGDKSAADLVLAGEFAHVDEARAERAAREVPACELDADEVE